MKSISMKNFSAPFMSIIMAMACGFVPSTAAAAPQTYAITNGVVHTMGPDGVIKEATVVFEGDRIIAVGRDVDIPAGAEVIDAAGKVVTPGLMNPLSYLGLTEVGAVDGTNDMTTKSDRFTAAHAVADAINPRSTLIPVSRIEGITRAVSAPRVGDDSLLGGRSAVISLGSVDDFIVKSHAAMHATFGESGAERAGGSRGAAMLTLREAFEDARDYARNRDAFNRAARRDYALSRLDLEALQPVLAGDMPFIVSVDRASDIEAMLRLADDYGLKLVIEGGSEAWMVADQLAAANVPVILNPYQNLPSNFERLGSSLQNAAALHAAGVLLAFGSGDSHNARNITQYAGNAVANGLPWNAALEAITVNPARIYGIANFGRLQPGQVADVVVWDGDPLEVTTFAERVFIAGRDIPMESRQSLLRERHRDQEERPQVYDKP